MRRLGRKFNKHPFSIEAYLPKCGCACGCLICACNRNVSRVDGDFGMPSSDTSSDDATSKHDINQREP